MVFSRYYICLDPPLVVDSSFVLYLMTHLFMPALASVERQSLLTECAIGSLDFASAVRSPVELSTHLPNFHMCNAASSRNNGGDCKAKAVGY